MGNATIERPNIVIILADDMGWGDPGCYNPDSRVPTPHIDRLAAQGLRFTNAHAGASVCTPSRYGLLTGRYAWRTRLKEGTFYGYCRSLIEPGRMTIASMLRAQGYATACVGKWHVGMDWTPKEGDAGDWPEGTPVRRHSGRIGHRVDFSRPIANGPNRVGFDVFFGTAACSTCNAPYVFIENDRVAVQPVEMTKPGVATEPEFMDPDWDNRVVDDVYCEKAIRFLEERAAVPSGAPFFLYLALSAPHGPWLPPARLEGRSGDGPRGDMCCWVDESVGKIDAALKRLGLADGTLLIFASDNGGLINRPPGGLAARMLAEDPGTTYEAIRRAGGLLSDHRVNGPWRGFKTNIWEGGTRIPFVARWPGRVRVGAVTDEEICLVDLLATFCALTGAELPCGAGEDSFNLLPALLDGERGRAIRDNLITHSYTGVFSIRIGKWKIIFNTVGSGGHKGTTPEWQPVDPGTPGQLFDLENDPQERDNLWGADKDDLILQLTYEIQRLQSAGRSRPERRPSS